MSNQEFTIMSPLQKASRNVIDQLESDSVWANYPWVTPKIEELRKALDAEIARVVEPFAWFGDDGVLHLDKPHEAYGPDPKPLYLHPPRPQATPIELHVQHSTLNDAVRLALDTLIEIRDNSFSWDSEYDKVVTSLKAVL